MNRWSKYIFKNGKSAKNRVVVPPMASQTANEEGYSTTATWDHYKRLATSGAGIIFAEYCYIHQSGKGEPNQLGVSSHKHITGLRKISNIIHDKGALSGLQIVHVGAKANSKLTGSQLIGADQISVPVKGLTLETPKRATLSQIEELIQWYLDSAQRAYDAGFDIVELHAAHGYGLNQWLSPITNQRSDHYAGDIIGRSLIVREIVKKIKNELPQLILAIRLPAQDHFEGGLTCEEMIWVTKELENNGVDLIDVSSGIGGWRRPRGRDGQGYLVDDANILKIHTTLPVIGVGGIKTGDYIDSILLAGKTDFTAIGRAILENPTLWYENNLRQDNNYKQLA